MITLIGHGYIGIEIAKRLKSFNWITHLNQIPSNTEFIINATGYVGHPNFDAVEKNKSLCVNANVVFPLALEKRTKLPILHITSGCIYTGYKQNGWSELDKPNFDFDSGNFYSGCKILFEQLLEPYLSKSYLFRIRMPFASTNNNKNLLTKYEQYNKLIDSENTITQIEEIADCMQFFVKERPDYGIYNACNPGSITTKRIVELLGLEKQWITEKEFEQVSPTKRSNCTLNVSKLNSIYNLRTVEEAMIQTIKKYKEFK